MLCKDVFPSLPVEELLDSWSIYMDFSTTVDLEASNFLIKANISLHMFNI